jgi:hypothetical protein
MYYDMFQQMKKTLTQQLTWLDAATAHAQSRGFDANAFLTLRLAPDQFALTRQIQIACDTAKLAASRLTGKEAPTFADNEQTLDDLRTRVKSTLAYLDTLREADFAEAATRVISQPRWEGKTMTGARYFLEHAVPNFFFHSSHAYAILRHAGVNLGKKDFLGPLTFAG